MGKKVKLYCSVSVRNVNYAHFTISIFPELNFRVGENLYDQNYQRAEVIHGMN